MAGLEGYNSPQIKLVAELDRAYKDKNIDFLSKRLHKDFRYIVYPRSLGRPVVNREEFIGNLAAVPGTPIGFSETTYHSVIEAPGKAVLHATTEIRGVPGKDVIANEAIYILEFVTEDGTLKFKQLEEFADSKNEFNLSKVLAQVNAK